MLPQLEEFKYLGVLFISEGKMEREINRWIGGVSSDVDADTKSRGKAFNLQVNLHPHSPL